MARTRRQQDDDPISQSTVPGGEEEDSKDGKKHFIGGFPDDFRVPGVRVSNEERHGGGRTRTFVGDTKPLYYTGDDYIPSNFSADTIWMIQQQLAKVGLLRGNFSKQVWDPTTRNAYKNLLALANAQGINADEALQQLLANATGPESGQYTTDAMGNIIPVGTKEVAPLITQTTDPTKLRQLFRAAVIEKLGEGWSEEKINNMVAAYNQVEVQKQTEAYNLTNSGNAGTIVDTPTPESFIEDQVLKQDPVGVQTNEALDFTSQFMDLANSPAWGSG